MILSAILIIIIGVLTFLQAVTTKTVMGPSMVMLMFSSASLSMGAAFLWKDIFTTGINPIYIAILLLSIGFGTVLLGHLIYNRIHKEDTKEKAS